VNGGRLLGGRGCISLRIATRFVPNAVERCVEIFQFEGAASHVLSIQRLGAEKSGWRTAQAGTSSSLSRPNSQSNTVLRKPA